MRPISSAMMHPVDLQVEQEGEREHTRDKGFIPSVSGQVSCETHTFRNELKNTRASNWARNNNKTADRQAETNAVSDPNTRIMTALRRARAPDIDRLGVAAPAEKDLGRAVPARDDVLSHELARVLVRDLEVDTRQTEVADLELAVLLHEQICGLQIAVQDVARMLCVRVGHECNAG